MPKLKLTSVAVLELSAPEAGQVLVFDSTLSGFGVRVTPTKRTYFCEARVHGKTRRVTIGSTSVFTAEKAKKEAQKILGAMAGGEDVNAAKSEARAKTVKLSEAVTAFLAGRTLKPNTEKSYRNILAHNFGDWDAKQLRDITPAMMLKRFNIISESGGEAIANLAARVFRSMWNFTRSATAKADGSYTLPDCPVRRISETRSWNKATRRQTYLTPDVLPAWFAAVQGISSTRHPDHALAFQDYVLLTLYTGLRRNEGLSLAWSSVNMAGKTFTVQETKNGRPLVLPMSKQVHEIFQRRQALNAKGFVFAGEGKTGRMVDPRHFHEAVKKVSGTDFTLHDLRRTFITVAEGLDLSGYALKRLLNHVDQDVTQGYIVANPERLREPLQKIADQLDLLGKPKEELAQPIAAIEA